MHGLSLLLRIAITLSSSVLLLAAGCASSTSSGCRTRGDCYAAMVCVDGVCVAPGSRDSGGPDTARADTGSGPGDANVADTAALDTGLPDTGGQDGGPGDTGTPDTGTPDTGTPDTGSGCAPGLGLVGHWPFDGNGSDASGAARDLALLGAPGFGPGRFGQALVLSGSSSQYADRIVDDAAYNFGGADFTVLAWINYATTSGEQVLIEKFDGASGPGWTLTKIAGQNYRFAASTGSFDTPTLTIPTGTWHFVGVRRQGATLSIWFNGASSATSTVSGALGPAAAPLRVGRRNDGDSRVFATNGSVDEVSIWSRALSDAEIVAMYAGGAGVAICP